MTLKVHILITMGGKYVAGSNWMGVAFENSHNECYRIIKDSLMAELRKID